MIWQLPRSDIHNSDRVQNNISESFSGEQAVDALAQVPHSHGVDENVADGVHAANNVVILANLIKQIANYRDLLPLPFFTDPLLSSNKSCKPNCALKNESAKCSQADGDCKSALAQVVFLLCRAAQASWTLPSVHF